GSWRKFGRPGYSSAYQISVGADGNLYYNVFTDLFRSTTDGLSWTRINTPASFIPSQVTALSDGTIILYGSRKIFQSTDQGQSWNTGNFNDELDGLYPGKQPGWVYGIHSGKLHVSKDQGLNWIQLYSDNFGNHEKEVVETANNLVLVSGTDFIWRLDTNGVLLRKTTIQQNTNTEVQMALSKSGRLFAYESDRSFYSDNLGDNWTVLPNFGFYGNVIEKFAATRSGSVFGVRKYKSLYRTDDNGQTWVFAASGLNEAAVLELDFISATRFLALTNDGLFYTGDDGKAWSLIMPSADILTNLDRVRRVVLHGEQIYFADRRGIHYFKDWKTPPVTLTNIIKPVLNFNLFENGRTGSLFVADDDGLYRSVNKGQNWTDLNRKGILLIHDFPNGELVAVTSTEILKSADDGSSWNKVLDFPAPIQNFNLADNDLQSAYLMERSFGTTSMYVTEDLGNTWDRIAVSSASGLNLEPKYGFASNNLGHWYAVDMLRSQPLRNTPGGPLFQPFGDHLNLLSGLAVSPDQKIYFMTAVEGLYRTFQSTSSAKVLIGNVFEDDNKNCIRDAQEGNIGNALVEADNGTDRHFAYSNKYGIFLLPLVTGTYDIRVATRNNYWTSCTRSVIASSYNTQDTLFLGLKVNTRCPYMEVDMQTNLLRRCFESTIYLHYANTGTQDAANAYVEVELDSFLKFISSTIPLTSQTGRLFRFNLGDVSVNQSGSFSIQVEVSCDAALGQVHCASAQVYPDSLCKPATLAKIQTDARCLGDSVQLIIRNIGNGDMTTAKTWSVIDLSQSSSQLKYFDSGIFFLTAGQEFTKTIATRSRILFVAEQDDSYPDNRQSRTEIISCTSNPLPGDPPFRITNLDEEEAFISKFCLRNRGSYDPNDITGYPVGLTDKKYIDDYQELEYLIRFQNTGTDTAFNIRIRNAVPVDQLDLATLVPGASSHPYSLSIDPQGRLNFSFSRIQLPDSTANEKASHGFVQYRIRPYHDQRKGTRIENAAEIFFDFNDAVKTNTDFHTIGVPIPVRVTNPAVSENGLSMHLNPNPVDQNTLLRLINKSPGARFVLICRDAMNRQMWSRLMDAESLEIQRENLPAGIYMLTLADRQGKIWATQKMVVE
ncbi:MAG TPA: hypothetical protein VFX48_01435, partial [Saprospiraceae bacterium]|nr:hypothetical protein [Saprospiraceae bacterium]